MLEKRNIQYFINDWALKLPKLSINIQEINGASDSKFLGGSFGWKFSWKEHLNIIKLKLPKTLD